MLTVTLGDTATFQTAGYNWTTAFGYLKDIHTFFSYFYIFFLFFLDSIIYINIELKKYDHKTQMSCG